MRIELHIERLLLDGVPITAAQLPALRVALERQLEELLGAQPGRIRALAAAQAQPVALGGPTRGTDRPSPQSPPLHLRADMSARTIGNRIAHALHGSLGEER